VHYTYAGNGGFWGNVQVGNKPGIITIFNIKVAIGYPVIVVWAQDTQHPVIGQLLRVKSQPQADLPVFPDLHL
jgi:hypothetical protein